MLRHDATAFRILILGCFLLPGLLSRIATAQTPAHGIESTFIVKQWTAEDNLPVQAINDVAQTRDGYLWLTTNGGLVRFDGRRFVSYTTSNNPDLVSNLLAELYEDPQGNLWIRLAHGDILRYREGVFTAFDQTNGLPGRATGTFYADGDTLWVLTDWGLAYYYNGVMQPYRPEEIRAYVTDLLRDQNGSLWVSTYRDGLIQVRPDGTMQPYGVQDGLPDAPIRTLYEDRQSNLWVGTEQGVVRRRNERFEVIARDEQPWTEPIHSIYQDTSDTLWFGGVSWWSYYLGTLTPFTADDATEAATDDKAEDITGTIQLGPDGHLWRIQGKRLYRDNALVYEASSNLTYGFCFDREGNLWLGTDDGLIQLRERVVHVLSEADGLPDRNLSPILQDRDGALWLGTWSRGLVRYTDAGMTTYDLGADIGAGPRPNNQILSLFQDPQGTIWVGRGGVLCHLQGTRCVIADIPLDPVLYEDVRAIHQDYTGRMWLGTGYSGLVLGSPTSDGYTWTHLTADNGLTSDWIRVILETNDGDLYVGTSGGGLLRFVPPNPAASPNARAADWGSLEPFTTADGLAFDNVRDVYEDEDGLLWIATEDQGLCRLDHHGNTKLTRDQYICLNASDGFFDNTIHRIIEDDAGRLWMSTNRGIFWVERAELNAFAAGRIGSVSPMGYTEFDGMRSRQANGGVQPAGIKANDGTLWFPTLDGAAVINPAEIPRPQAPPVVIESVRVEEQVRPRASTLDLAPGERNVEISYTAPVFSRPEDVRFRYRLDDYDDAWHEAGTLRQARYENLPPGTYTFHVVAGLGGSWNETGASMTIARSPYFWETTWFLLLCGLVGGFSIFGLYRYRLRQVEARALALEQKVDERTAQIREHQSQLEQQAEQLRRANELKSHFLANISHEFRTPLTLTLGPLEDIRNGHYGPLQRDVINQLNLAHRNARRLLRLINQLLDLSRLEAGALVLHPRRYDLTGFLRRLTHAFDSLAQARHITLRFGAPKVAVLHIFDADKLEKIVLNLLSNAFKFTPEGGMISVSLHRSPERHAIIKVTDTGAGIPAEHLPHLFDRFYQVDAATTRKHEGTGIGLALIKELIDLHGGSITVESIMGEGTTFTVTLPEAPTPEESDETRPDAEAGDESDVVGVELLDVTDDLASEGPLQPAPVDLPAEEAMLVLVVEDKADMRAYLRLHLEDIYLVVEAENGIHGLEQARELVPDLVISDVMMPEMDGYGLCQALKTDERTSHIPVMLLTAKADTQSRIEGYERGADAYLAKPFNAEELRVRTRTLIKQRRKLQMLFSNREPTTLEATVADLPALDAAFLEQVHQTVMDNLDNPDFGVDMLAEAVGMSRRQLLRKLKALTDEKPNALIRRLRLERAAEMLRGQLGSIKEIAYAVGFRSATHFSKIFQETYNVSPTAYAEHQTSRSDLS